MCEILLMDPKLTQEQRELGDGIQRSANALLTVINDILDLSKVESGMMDIEMVPFSLSVVLRDVVRMLSFEADRKKLQFLHEIDFHGTDNLTVLGDPGRVRQILTNLLSNAVKFTHQGSVELKARAEHEDEETIIIHFTVKDTGIGISHADQRKLFQPFTQADSTTARRFGGTGLGLTICKNVRTILAFFLPLLTSVKASQSHGR
jgi:signal transduction histidine kinase